MLPLIIAIIHNNSNIIQISKFEYTNMISMIIGNGDMIVGTR